MIKKRVTFLILNYIDVKRERKKLPPKKYNCNMIISQAVLQILNIIHSGRERSIPPKEYLSGCMTNPNCEYSLNLPALVTLADWVNNPSWDKTGISN